MNANRLLPSRAGRTATVLAIVAVALLPMWLDDDFWMLVFGNAGIFAIGAVGLSLLTGYAGQVSLGHAAFLSIGGYTAVWFSSDKGWPLPLWLLAVTLVGAAIGALVGPFALRFKGNYLVVITLALLFITVHVLDNWDRFSNGADGKSATGLKLWFLVDFENLSVFGKEFTDSQGRYYLAWIILGLVLVMARNIVRSRPGRALQAIRDRDVAAEVVGVDTARYKIAVFAVSSGLATLAGGLYAANIGFLTPGDPAAQLFLSIRFVAIIIVGGLGSLYGVVIGALLLGPLPELLRDHADKINFTVPLFDEPLIQEGTGPGLFTSSSLAEILFGVSLVAFLIFQPRGVVGLIDGVRHRLGARRDGSTPDAD